MRGFVAGCLILLLAGICIPVAGAQSSAPEYSKVVQIHLTYQGSAYSVESLEVRYGKAPGLALRHGPLQGIILDSQGKTLKFFQLQDPGIAYGDIAGSSDTEALLGYSEITPASGVLLINIPYLAGMQAFRLSDARDGTRLATVDLDPPLASFCADYPQDPDCLARVSPASSASATPDRSMILYLAVLFSASVLIAAGIAIRTLRRREVQKTGKQRIVLIADDDPEIVNLVDIFFTQKGFAILRAASGNECLSLLKNTIPDVILLDVRMEPMDGWQTLRQIRKDPATRPVPVLMLTGGRLSADEAKHYNICIDDYIIKPFRLDTLFAAVDGIITRKQKLKETLVLARKAGVEKEKFCELASLSRHISVNRKLIDIMGVPQAIPVPADLDVLDSMLVVDYMNIKTRDHEKRANELREEINAALRARGLPLLNW